MPVFIIIIGIVISILGISSIALADVIDLFGVILFAFGSLITGIGLGVDAESRENRNV